MAHRLKKIKLPAREAYGAAELKYEINANTSKAFLITMSLTIFLLLTKLAVGASGEKESRIFHTVKISPSWEAYVPEDEKQEFSLPPLIPEVNADGLLNEVMGKLVPVPSAEMPMDAPDIAGFENLNNAASTTGDGIIDKPVDLEEYEIHKAVVIDAPLGTVKKDVESAPNEYVHYQTEPGVDLKALQELIVYPPMAIKANIQGQVLLQFSIDENGNTGDVRVLKSVSLLLNDAAVEAVLKIKCSPGIVNNKAVKSWVVVPINFTLSRN